MQKTVSWADFEGPWPLPVSGRLGLLEEVEEAEEEEARRHQAAPLPSQTSSETQPEELDRQRGSSTSSLAEDALRMLKVRRRAAGEVLDGVEVQKSEVVDVADADSSSVELWGQGPSSGVLEGVQADEVLEDAVLDRRRRRSRQA